MDNASTNSTSSNQPHLSQGRSVDFSFSQKYLIPKVFRQAKEQKKGEEICSSSNETRDMQITFSPKQTQNHNFTVIQREVEQDFMLSSITESENQQGGDYVHLFSNIRCSHSSQAQEQSFNQYRVEKCINQKKQQSTSIKKISPKEERDKSTYRISTIIKDQMTSQFVQLDFTLPNVYESDVFVQKDFKTYRKQVMNIYRLSNIRIGQKQIIHLKSLKKITVFPILIKKNGLQLELIHSGGRTVFGSELKRHLYFLPEHYIWFAKIINAKLMNLGQKFPSSAQVLYKYVSMGWNGNFSQGFIFKKSKYLGNWEKRYVIINTEGLFSYREVNQNYTIFIPMEDVRILSTEFDFYQKKLIVRLQTEEQKIDFAIPVHDFCLKIENNWLFAFYRLLMEHKHHIKIS